MPEGPNIAGVAALVSDPARANMLAALMSGMALTAGELAAEAGVSRSTASGHLARLLDAGFLAVATQGRHRYYRLADAEVAHTLESLAVAAAAHAPRTRPGPRDPALRRARTCYDHLAGAAAVAIHDGCLDRGWLVPRDGLLAPTEAGRAAFRELGIDLDRLPAGRRPLCRSCLDWSERRPHLAGPLAAALLDRILALGWARRIPGSRVVALSPRGEAALRGTFEVRTPSAA